MRDLIELVRAPAALSVPGDAVAGASAADCLDQRTAGIAAASVCLYWAGMAANDWADRELDSVERPERPIPSGRVSPAQALTVASGLTVAGLALAALSGNRRTLVTAGALAGAIWTYDLRLKNTTAGPAGMALCRGLDVLLGASTGRMRRAVRPAAIVAAHTYALTELSRREVTGATRALPLATMAATAAIAAAAAAPRATSPAAPRATSPAAPRATPSAAPWATTAARRDKGAATEVRMARASSPAAVPSLKIRSSVRGGAQMRDQSVSTRTGPRIFSALLAGWYAAMFGRAQQKVLLAPKAENVRASVGAGIMSLPALQGALTAQAGRPFVGAAVAIAAPIGKRLIKAVSAT